MQKVRIYQSTLVYKGQVKKGHVVTHSQTIRGTDFSNIHPESQVAKDLYDPSTKLGKKYMTAKQNIEAVGKAQGVHVSDLGPYNAILDKKDKSIKFIDLEVSKL